MDSGDWSWQKAALQDRIHDVANQWIKPSVLYRPRVIPDGNMWLCIYGENLQESVCAHGKTPAEAVDNFDYYAWYGKPIPTPNSGEAKS